VFYRLAMYIKAGGPVRFVGLLVAFFGIGLVADAIGPARWTLVAIGVIVFAVGWMVMIRPRPFG